MSSEDGFVDYYEVLGISADAGRETIEEAVKEQRKTWRKRQGLHDEQQRRLAETRMSQLTEAERVLLNEDKREEYDERRAKHAARPQPAPNTDSGSGSDWLARAEEFLAVGDAMSAAYAAREATSERGDEHRAWAVRGRANMMQGDYQSAMFEMREALRLKTDEPDYYFDLGLLQEEVEDWGDAIASYQRAAQLDPDNPMGQVAVASVYLRTDRTREGLELLEETYRAHPEHEETQHYLAIALHDRCIELMEPLPVEGTRAVTSEEAAREIQRMAQRAKKLDVQDADLRSNLNDLVKDANKALESKFDQTLVWAPARQMGCLGIFAVGMAWFIAGGLFSSMFSAASEFLGVLAFIGYIILTIYLLHRPVHKINKRAARIQREEAMSGAR